MRRTLLLLLLTTFIAALLVLGRAVRRMEDASSLTREARGVLDPPFARVPELSAVAAQRAVQLLEDAAALHDDGPTRALLAYATALDELQKDRPERAQRALADAKRLEADEARVALLAAALAQRGGDHVAAAAGVATAAAASPKDSRVRLLAADVASDGGDFRRAGELLEGLIGQHGELPALVNRRGLLREQRGDTEGALADYERASTAQGPASAQINRARLLLDAGRAVEAEQAFSLAIERGSSFDAWLGRGLSRFRQGDLAGARFDVEHARKLGPTQPGPLLLLADLDVQAGEAARAIERYRAALLVAPDDAVAWLKLGNALMRERSLSEANAAYERALTLSPGLAAAHNGVGAVLLARGDEQGAELALARAAELDSRDPNPLLNLALLRARHGDLRGAREARAEAAVRRTSHRFD